MTAKDFIKKAATKKAGEFSGLGIMIFCMCAMLAMISYNPYDPSSLSATNAEVSNLLGEWGAEISAGLMQWFGYGAYPILLFGVVISNLFLKQKKLQALWRLPLFLLGWILIVPFLGSKGLSGSIGYLAYVGLIQNKVPGLIMYAMAITGIFIMMSSMGMNLAYGFKIAKNAILKLLATEIKVKAREENIEVSDIPQRRDPIYSSQEVPWHDQPQESLHDEAPTMPEPTRSVAKPKTSIFSKKKDDANYTLPSSEMLFKPQGNKIQNIDENALAESVSELEQVLKDYGIRGEIVNVRPGPVVTLYEMEPAPGLKSSRVIGLADDIARSMSAVSARVAVVPGKNVIGIELPNHKRETVHLREIVDSKEFKDSTAKLGLSLGKDIGGTPVVADLTKMPHLLVAGTTGSGKSVGVNAMILSLLYKLSPEQCKFIMIDPKMLELSIYDGIPHLLAPVVTDPKKAVVALKWVVREMESRYQAMSKLAVRNIDGYNQRITEAEANGEILTRRVQTGFDRESGTPIFEQQELDMTPLPYIVVVVDEMADLMLVAGKDIEAAVQRLAQMARAAGIHLIMATQRPSVDVITGTIKANFPTRISFQVTSKIDSRTILGEPGGEQLLGQGDMLYMAAGGRITRVHGPYVSDSDVEKIVQYLKDQKAPQYVESITVDESEDGHDAGSGASLGGDGDELYDKALAVVYREGKASTSFIQRQLRIGYNRAADLIDRMEKDGIVSPANHSGKREVLARRGGGEDDI